MAWDEIISETERDWLISGLEINSTVKATSVPLSKLRELFDAKADLKRAVQYLREGKARFAPNTDNSHVDGFLAKYADL